MRARARGPTRLVLRLYFPVMLSVIGSGATLTVIGFLLRPVEPEGEGDRAVTEVRDSLARTVTAAVATSAGDRRSMQELADRLDRPPGLDLTIFGADGTPWAEVGRWASGPLDRGELERLRREGVLRLDSPPRVAFAVTEGGELVAYGVRSLHPHAGARWRGGPGGMLPGLGRPPYWVPPFLLWTMVLALVLLAIVSVLFTRSVARPLSHLTDVAGRLGRGDLAARARLDRRDELGDLGRAFDEMADRITALLRAQTELLAGASHELRTPLARIRVALDIAGEGDADLAREQLGEIAQDLAELEALVADILIMARLDVGRDGLDVPRQPLRLEETSATALVEDAVARFRAARPDRVVEVELGGGLGSIEADRVLLRRVLTNLLDNADAYSDAGRPIELRARREGGGLVVEVEDRGIGIDEADLRQVFTPFFRTDRSRARKTGGVGLGLALARRVVEAHGGTISVESVPGEGSRFVVAIPGAS